MEHRTKDGSVMLIAEMETEHLQNTIWMIIKNIETYYSLLNTKVENDINDIVYWRRSYSHKELKHFIKTSSERLVYYIFEAQIRWIDYSSELQRVYNRKDKIKEVLYINC